MFGRYKSLKLIRRRGNISVAKVQFQMVRYYNVTLSFNYCVKLCIISIILTVVKRKIKKFLNHKPLGFYTGHIDRLLLFSGCLQNKDLGIAFCY